MTLEAQGTVVPGADTIGPARLDGWLEDAFGLGLGMVTTGLVLS